MLLWSSNRSVGSSVNSDDLPKPRSLRLCALSQHLAPLVSSPLSHQETSAHPRLPLRRHGPLCAITGLSARTSESQSRQLPRSSHIPAPSRGLLCVFELRCGRDTQQSLTFHTHSSHHTLLSEITLSCTVTGPLRTVPCTPELGRRSPQKQQVGGGSTENRVGATPAPLRTDERVLRCLWSRSACASSSPGALS